MMEFFWFQVASKRRRTTKRCKIRSD